MSEEVASAISRMLYAVSKYNVKGASFCLPLISPGVWCKLKAVVEIVLYLFLQPLIKYFALFIRFD